MTPLINNWQKIIKNIDGICNVINHIGLIDLSSTLHPKMAMYTFFSRAYHTFTKIEYIPDN